MLSCRMMLSLKATFRNQASPENLMPFSAPLFPLPNFFRHRFAIFHGEIGRDETDDCERLDFARGS